MNWQTVPKAVNRSTSGIWRWLGYFIMSHPKAGYVYAIAYNYYPDNRGFVMSSY